MLLTETIKNSCSAIKIRREATEGKQHAETYARALAQLSQATEGIKGTLECAMAMKEYGIVSTPLMDKPTRHELMTCIDDCGKAVSEMQLTPESVRLLKSKGDAFTAQIKIIWRDAAQQYSDGPKGYLSTISGLTSNPKQARELVDSIGKTIDGAPSVKAIKSLVSDVQKAKQITEDFSLNTEIEDFLKKVSSQQATVNDLTANVLNWLQEKNLIHKLKIRF